MASSSGGTKHKRPVCWVQGKQNGGTNSIKVSPPATRRVARRGKAA